MSVTAKVTDASFDADVLKARAGVVDSRAEWAAPAA